MEVTMFTWKCHKGHIRHEIALGIDIEGDLWVSFICKDCGEEVMTAIKISDMMFKAGHVGLNAQDLGFLKEMHILDEESPDVLES
mgnify:CR=1 FL=1